MKCRRSGPSRRQPSPPTGIGESAVPLVGPVLANAVYAASGRRVRHLPISQEGLIGDGDHRQTG
jgi:CO/xanthine dehydrogenase Mo-binding subunit